MRTSVRQGHQCANHCTHQAIDRAQSRRRPLATAQHHPACHPTSSHLPAAMPPPIQPPATTTPPKLVRRAMEVAWRLAARHVARTAATQPRPRGHGPIDCTLCTAAAVWGCHRNVSKMMSYWSWRGPLPRWPAQAGTYVRDTVALGSDDTIQARPPALPAHPGQVTGHLPRMYSSPSVTWYEPQWPQQKCVEVHVHVLGPATGGARLPARPN